MATNLARSAPSQKKIPVAQAKAKVIDLIQGGASREEAMVIVGRTVSTYIDWQKHDKDWANRIASIRQAQTEFKATGRPDVPDFPEFCADWLRQPLAKHQLQMLDVIEGREPRDIHDSMTFEAGSPDRITINVPPDHAKSTTFTVNYVVWLIHKNPDIRIVIVSKGTKLAEDFLYEIKLKLTSSVYAEMHQRFAPEGGWKDPVRSWTNDRIYVRGKNEQLTENGVQKDPTVQAMGLKGQIYGRRCDLIILDDIVDSDNFREVTTQLRKINRDISSRLPSTQNEGGLLLNLGTRIAPMDIHRSLHDQIDGDGNRVWTYFRMPAVLDYGTGDSKSWVTLWPERWNGPSLAKNKFDVGWNLIYQQLDVEDDMTFKAEAVNASINAIRFPGRLPMESGLGARPGGLAGLYMVGGLDPAAAGNTAIIIAGLDRETGKRFVIDGWNKPNATAEQIIDKFQEFTDLYQLNEWVIEQNALQRFIAQIPQVLDYARARGCKVTPHYTNKNKFDSDWGVQTMAPLFDSCVRLNEQTNVWEKTGKGFIELPSPRQNAWVNVLIQQLTIWQPEGMAQKQKTDLVMALWFTHIAFSDQMNRKSRILSHLPSPFMTPGRKRRQRSIDLIPLRAEAREREERGLV